MAKSAIKLVCAFSLGLSWFPIVVRAQETTLHFRADRTLIDVTFDRARVSADDVKRWMQLADFISNENGYQVPPSRAMCNIDDPRYVGCGTEQELPNVQNAALNLEVIRKNIVDLNPKRFPADLSPVVLYLRQIQYFALWTGTREFEFLQKGNVSALESVFQNIDPKASCGTVLNQIRGTSEGNGLELAYFDWYNCVVHEEMKQIGPYPHKTWESFLSAHGIRERAYQEDVD